MEEGSVAKVRQDFFTTNEGELSLQRGEIFQVHKVIDKYWCYGCSKGKFGQFPSNNLLSTNVPTLSQNEELFVALENFAGQEEGDLSFRKGDFIVGEEKMDEHWWRGYVQKGRSGMFPDNYTWQIDSHLLKKDGAEQVHLQARVKMSLTAQLDEEMDLRAGEIVTITEKIDKDWYRGVCGDRSGIFPASCVTILDDAPPSYSDILPKNETARDYSNFYHNTSSVTDSGCGSSTSTDLLTFSPEREIKPSFDMSELLDSYSVASDRSSLSSSTSRSTAMKDLLTFSPEREIAPTQDTADDDIFQDEYFRVNMPSAFGSSDRRSFQPSYDTSAVGSCVDVEENTSSVPPYGVTLYPFYAQFNNELSFHENEFIHLIRYVDNDWMEGELDGRRGIFPVNYINILVDCARPETDYLSCELETSSVSGEADVLAPHTLAKVKYNFDAQMSGDLCVKEGDIVMIVNSVNSDWYTVKNRVGTVGLCPANHLEMHTGSESSSLFRSSSFSTGDSVSALIETRHEQRGVSPLPCESNKEDETPETAEVLPTETQAEKGKSEIRTAPARPPPAKRKPVMPDRGPHRPAPPAPLPGKSPVHRSIRRLPRQTSAPSEKGFFARRLKRDFVKSEDPMPKEAIEEKRKKLSEQRQNVISELVITEKEYLRDLKMMYEVFNLYNPEHLESRGADVKVLFGNLLEVIQVSEELLDSLQWGMKNKEESEQMIGPCFLKHAETMKSVYTEYCTNHENALALLTKYEAIPTIQNMFEKGLETLRYQVTCFNMDSLLIKPVQRVLKYPLILNELIKSTEDSHPDKAELLTAIKVFTHMASDINECKRRKDIVSKYLVNGNDTLARRMGRLSLHSVAKKSSRIGARISSSLGLSSAPKDENFILQEKRFRNLEKTIRLFVKNVEVVMMQIHSEVKILFDIGEELVQYYGEQSSKAPEVECIRSAQRNIADSIWHGFRNTVNRRVVEPLTALADLFDGPSLLIDKRNDKLLDYDNVLARSEKSQDRRLIGELQVARSNYEALNQQLVEELPHFVDLSLDLLVQCIAAFIGARKLLSGNITQRYMTLMEDTGLCAGGGNVVEAFEVKHLLVCKQLARSSSSWKPLKSDIEGTSGPTTKESNKTPSPSAQKVGTLSTSQVPVQPASQCAYLRSKYSPDQLFRLKECHSSLDSYDLSLNRGHLVGVIKKQDPMGNTSRWFVDDGNIQGFVRSGCLEPAGSPSPSPVGFQSEGAISAPSRSSPGALRSTPAPPRNRPASVDRRASNPRPASSDSTQRNIRSSENLSVDASGDSGTSGNVYDLPPDYDEVAGNNVPETAFYYALYDFEATTQHALSVRCGQVVNVLQRQDLDGNREWWFVENRHGAKGFVPANYLNPYRGN